MHGGSLGWCARWFVRQVSCAPLQVWPRERPSQSPGWSVSGVRETTALMSGASGALVLP